MIETKNISSPKRAWASHFARFVNREKTPRERAMREVKLLEAEGWEVAGVIRDAGQHLVVMEKPGAITKSVNALYN